MFHPHIWCEHKYWKSWLTGLSKWSAVSCSVNSSDIKSRECVVSVIRVLHLMTKHTNKDEDEGADFESKASNLDDKKKAEASFHVQQSAEVREKSLLRLKYGYFLYKYAWNRYRRPLFMLRSHVRHVFLWMHMLYLICFGLLQRKTHPLQW